jgi:hypothetical protein
VFQYATDIYAQRLNASGEPLWTGGGKPVYTGYQGQEYPIIAPDGAGGAVVVWLDWRTLNLDIYAQRIDSDGNMMWDPNGVAIWTHSGYQIYGGMVVLADGSTVFVWDDHRNGLANKDVYAQRVSAGGAVQWVSNGIAVSNAASQQGSSRVIPDNTGGVIVAWSDERSGDPKIYAQRVNAAGTSLWTANGVLVGRYLAHCVH